MTKSNFKIDNPSKFWGFVGQHTIVFAACVLFPGAVTAIAPASWITFHRSGERVTCTTRTCVFFVVPYKTQKVDQVSEITTREKSATTQRVRKHGRDTNKTVHVDGEGFMQIRGEQDQVAEVSVSPASLQSVVQKSEEFLNSTASGSKTIFAIANWKFGFIMGGVLSLMTALWVLGYSLGFLKLIFSGVKKLGNSAGLALVASLLSSSAICQEPSKTAEPDSVLSQFRERIPTVKKLVVEPWTKTWIEGVAKLPPIQLRAVRVKERDIQVDENRFYNRYGSPLAYARLLDIAIKHGFQPKPKRKVFDFGYGSIGHLRMLAQQGLDVTAVDVDALLPAMYADSSGQVESGSLQLLSGKFPAEEKLVMEAGSGYDLFLSKNTLKLGYIHPTRELADPRHKIDLGVSDDTFLTKVADMLKPGGFLVIYNFCPAKSPADKPYIPWAEGECPFLKATLESHGFEVLEFDVDDSNTAREFGRALGWDQPGGMNLERDLFAWYTIARKK